MLKMTRYHLQGKGSSGSTPGEKNNHEVKQTNQLQRHFSFVYRNFNKQKAGVQVGEADSTSSSGNEENNPEGSQNEVDPQGPPRNQLIQPIVIPQGGQLAGAVPVLFPPVPQGSVGPRMENGIIRHQVQVRYMPYNRQSHHSIQ